MNKFNGFNINSLVFLSQQDCLRIHCNSAFIFHLKLIVPHTLLILNTSFVSALCSIKALSDSKMLTQQKVDITHSHPKNSVLYELGFFFPALARLARVRSANAQDKSFFVFVFYPISTPRIQLMPTLNLNPLLLSVV